MLLNFDKKNPIHNYIDQNHQKMLDELVDWLKIPSISADSSCNQEVRNAAIKTKSLLDEAGVNETEIIETKGHPIVYGEHIIDINAPTVLVYGHYDVQPATPLELWNSPPFEPLIKDGKIYARGAADDKGQVMMHIKAFELMKKLDLISCNIKFLIEGEEEVGSDNLNAFVSQNKNKLACDVILISDTSMIALDTPSITVGLKGLCYMEVTLTGPKIDLHSGVYGGTVANPANVLCDIIAQLKDEDGKITIPNFYDKVVDLSDAEREALNRTPFNLDEFKKSLDIAQEEGEKGYTTVERAGIRPTLDVNGIWGGYIGEGAKTVLPSKAYAKISMRLVPNQDEEEIAQLFQTYFKSLLPPTVKAEILVHHGGPPYVTPIEGKAYQAASAAIQESFGKKVIPTRDGGSIPIVAHFSNELQADTVLLGMGLDSDAIHSPNEKFELNNFYMGIATIPLFYKYFAKN